MDLIIFSAAVNVRSLFHAFISSQGLHPTERHVHVIVDFIHGIDVLITQTIFVPTRHINYLIYYIGIMNVYIFEF